MQMTSATLRRLCATLTVAALLLATQAQSQADVAGGFRAAAGAVQRLMAAVAQLRLTTCAPVYQQAGGFLFDKADVEFVVQPLGPDPNRWPTVVTAESSHAVGPAGAPQTRLTTLIVAPAGDRKSVV